MPTNKRRPKRNIMRPLRYMDFQMGTNGAQHQAQKEKRPLHSIHSNLFRDQQEACAKKSKTVDQNKVNINALLNSLKIDNMTAADYIPSELDKPHLVSVRKVDVLKKMECRGLFAENDIPKGTILGVYTGEEFTLNQYELYSKENPGLDNSYLMVVNGRHIDGLKKGNFTRYINFSDTQDNVAFIPFTLNGKRVIIIKALREIKKGEQLLVDYNVYDEQISKEYCFLNPQDSYLSAVELYQQNVATYEMVSLRNGGFLLSTNRYRVLATQVGKLIVQNQSLATADIQGEELHLPFLNVDDSERILDFQDSDTATPLMLACYLGQLANVQWLIMHGAAVNQQQNQSGHCPLVFALEGYQRANQTKKSTFVVIIQELIMNEAKVTIRNRQDQIILHKMITALSTADFLIIINLLVDLNQPMRPLFNYIDQDNLDIVLHALRFKDFDKAKILLEAYPDFFKHNYLGIDKSSNTLNYKSFILATKEYTPDDKRALLEVIGVYIPEKLKVKLDLVVSYRSQPTLLR